MRIAVHAADAGGCGHYRQIWPGYAVNKAGLHSVDVLVPGTDTAPSLPALWDESGKVVGLGELCEGEVWPDLVILQRPLKYGLSAIIPHLQEAGVAVVVELDDDFASVTPRNVAWHKDLHHGVERLLEACDRADLVTVSTPALAERYGQHCRVKVLPNYVPEQYLTMNSRRDDSETWIGWTGSVATHRDDLGVIGGGLATAIRGTDTKIAIVGTGVGTASRLGTGRIDNISGWVPLSQYPYKIVDLDIGLAPLEHTRFNEAKSWLKPLEYASLGVPCVATDIVEYSRLKASFPGISLQLVEHPAGWKTAIKNMLSKDWLKEVRPLTRAAVAGATIEAHAQDWADAWTLAARYHREGY